MEEGAIEDMFDLFPQELLWGAVMFQEGPYVHSDSYFVSQGGHAVYSGACTQWKRSVTVAIHRKWVTSGASLVFSAVGRRAAYLDLESGSMKIRLVTSHSPHKDRPDDEYDDFLELLTGVVEEGRRRGCTNIVGLDANAIIGTSTGTDLQNIIGPSGHGRICWRGHMLTDRLHGVKLAAATTCIDKSFDESWAHRLWSTGGADK